MWLMLADVLYPIPGIWVWLCTESRKPHFTEKSQVVKASLCFESIKKHVQNWSNVWVCLCSDFLPLSMAIRLEEVSCDGQYLKPDEHSVPLLNICVFFAIQIAAKAEHCCYGVVPSERCLCVGVYCCVHECVCVCKWVCVCVCMCVRVCVYGLPSSSEVCVAKVWSVCG